MSGRVSAALSLWRARHVRTIGDRAYVAYLTLMVALVTVAPVSRAVWLSVSGAEGIAVVSSTSAPSIAALAVAGLWAGALLLGRDRGPALLPLFPTYALATSDVARSTTFRGPVLRAGLLPTTATAAVAGVVGCSLANSGLADPHGAAVFIAAGGLTGIIATVAWLIGQVSPRGAIPIGLGILGGGMLTALVPALQPLTPWGWVALTYPVTGSAVPVVALTALAAALVATVPGLMNRLGTAELLAQGVRWDSATTHAAGMDLSAAAATYRPRSSRGRGLRAVRANRSLPVMFLIRDAVGAVRTPGRLIAGILALGAAGALITFAFAPAAPSWALGSAAGLVLLAGLGPLTDGIRHAASVAADLPLYGISDERLLAGHVLFPLTVTVIVLIAVVAACSVLAGIGAAPPVLCALALGPLVLVARISSALKGPLPPSLLTPIPTPLGDLGAAVRLAWALDGVLLAAAAGAAAALVFDSPVLLIVATFALVGIGMQRWRHRG